MIHDRLISTIFRGASLLITLTALLMHIGVFSGEPKFGGFMYYTVLSNVLAIVMFSILIISTIRRSRTLGRFGKTGYYSRLEMICVVDLMLTMLVYWTMLAPGSFSMNSDYNLWSFDNLTLHLFTPLLCLLDYILFTDSGHLRYADSYGILVFPLCYVALTSFAGTRGYVYRVAEDGPVHFPYFFLDFERNGESVLLYILAIVFVFLIISHLFYLFDRRVTKPVLFPVQERFQGYDYVETGNRR